VNERRFPFRPRLRWMCTCHRGIRAKMVGCGRPSRVVLAPVAGVKFVDACESQPGLVVRLNPQTTVTKTNSSPGRSRSKPLKPSCRECRLIPEYLWRLPCAYYLCTRAAGALDTRHSLRPSLEGRLRLLLKVANALFIPGRNSCKTRGDHAARMRKCGWCSVRGTSFETALCASSG
jgi:hypothetical protein